ncbi:RES family NAD+ phosphorylase [Rhodococcus koreensis]
MVNADTPSTRTLTWSPTFKLGRVPSTSCCRVRLFCNRTRRPKTASLRANCSAKVPTTPCARCCEPRSPTTLPDRPPPASVTVHVGSLTAGTKLWRIHSSDPNRGVLTLNPTPAGAGGGRFDSSDGSYHYSYFGGDISACIAETYCRSLPLDDPVPKSCGGPRWPVGSRLRSPSPTASRSHWRTGYIWRRLVRTPG